MARTPRRASWREAPAHRRRRWCLGLRGAARVRVGDQVSPRARALSLSRSLTAQAGASANTAASSWAAMRACHQRGRAQQRAGRFLSETPAQHLVGCILPEHCQRGARAGGERQARGPNRVCGGVGHEEKHEADERGRSAMHGGKHAKAPGNYPRGGKHGTARVLPFPWWLLIPRGKK